MSRLVLPRRKLLLATPMLILPHRRAEARIPGMLGFGGRPASGGSFSTWNPSDLTAGVTLTNGNLTATYVSGFGGVRGTKSYVATGGSKVYYEHTFTTFTSPSNYIGILSSSGVPNQVPGNADNLGFTLQSVFGSNTIAYFSNNGGTTWSTTTSQASGTGTIWGIAVDFGANQFWIRNCSDIAHGATWNPTLASGAADPASNTGGQTFTPTAGNYFVHGEGDFSSGSNSGTINVGATSFNLTAPVGFSAWG